MPLDYLPLLKKQRRRLVLLSLRLPNTHEVARFAKAVLGDHVGEWSTKGGMATLATDDVLTKAVDITRLQVPPPRTKETA